jgi:hypothetical protein
MDFGSDIEELDIRIIGANVNDAKVVAADDEDAEVYAYADANEHALKQGSICYGDESRVTSADTGTRCVAEDNDKKQVDFSSSNHNNSSFPPTGDHDDSPERLVQEVNDAVRAFRVALLIVLLSATIASSVFLFAFLRRNEVETFENEFQAMASTVVRSLYDMKVRQLWLCRNVANAISLSMAHNQQQSNTNRSLHSLYLDATDFDIDFNQWARLTHESTLEIGSHLMAYSPVLTNDEQRHRFETSLLSSPDEGFSIVFPGDSLSTANTNSSSIATTTAASDAICILCPNGSVVAPDVTVEIIDVGTYTCGEIELAGRTGLIPVGVCDPLQEVFDRGCQCNKNTNADEQNNYPSRNNVASDDDRVSNRSFREGLFEVATNDTLLDREWAGGPYLPFWYVNFAF